MFVDAVATIRFRLPSEPTHREWSIGAAGGGVDTDESLRAHLARWNPIAEYLGACIRRVQDDVVEFDTRRE